MRGQAVAAVQRHKAHARHTRALHARGHQGHALANGDQGNHREPLAHRVAGARVDAGTGKAGTAGVRALAGQAPAAEAPVVGR